MSAHDESSPGKADQDAVFAFLADPATHGLSEPVRRIDTHGAAVFLAGPDVYKVKKAVRFPFMDQTSLDQRRTACAAEVAINRRFAPDLYLGTVPVTRGADGMLRLGGPTPPVEWAVHLKRFDESKTLDLVAERGEFTPGLVAAVAALILQSHRTAATGDGSRATTGLAAVVEESLEEIVAAPEIFPAEPVALLAAAMRAALTEATPLLLARGAGGRVRRCHGDLHLRNIALLDRGPVLFDAIEFDESIATTDVLYDLAFALVDLIEHGLPAEANLLLNRYLWACDDIGIELAGLAVLPLFLSLRAVVSAKIAAIRFRDVDRLPGTRAEARRYFDLAAGFLEPALPVLVAIGGMSGSGKSTVSAAIAPAVGRLPGAVHLRSDIERKRRSGVAELARLPQSAYRPEVTEAVFDALRRQAGIAVCAGHSVIVDAVHRQPDERRLIAEVAERAGVRFIGLWLDGPPEVLAARVGQRTGDASDATPDIVAAQARAPVGPIDWTHIDASGTPEASIAAALLAVGGKRPG